MRFRACLFGAPLGSWLPTAELAKQNAIEAGEASREPATGMIFLSPGVTIESDGGDAPMPAHLQRWAIALDLIRDYRGRADEYIGDQIRLAADDADRIAHWRVIQKRVAEVMSAAAKDARS